MNPLVRAILLGAVHPALTAVALYVTTLWADSQTERLAVAGVFLLYTAMSEVKFQLESFYADWSERAFTHFRMVYAELKPADREKLGEGNRELFRTTTIERWRVLTSRWLNLCVKVVSFLLFVYALAIG